MQDVLIQAMCRTSIYPEAGGVVHRKAEDESKIESLEVARTALEEKLRLVEAKKMKLEQRVSALTKQNASLAKAASQPV